MTLRQKQSLHVHRCAMLVLYAESLGYELTYGDAYRDPRVHGKLGKKKSYSAAKSRHKLRLATDFNLFKHGKYLTSTKAHAPLGEYWEKMGGTWGGRFKRADGNHYQTD